MKIVYRFLRSLYIDTLLSDYHQILKYRGLKLAFYYFFEVHLFDIIFKTNTAKIFWISENPIPYMASWTSVTNKIFKKIRILILLKNGTSYNEISGQNLYNFIDIGSGKGKVIIIAQKKLPFIHKFYGLEKNEDLINTANKNLQITKTDSNILKHDESRFYLRDLSDHMFIVYLYNPFDSTTLINFLENNYLRIILLIYVNPVHKNIINGYFKPIREFIGWHNNQNVFIYEPTHS